MHDRASQLFYSKELTCRIRFQKDRSYTLIFIHFSKSFFISQLGEGIGDIRMLKENEFPVFQYSRSKIVNRNTMELLSLILFSKNDSTDDLLKDEAARAILLDFLNKDDNSFHPRNLKADDLIVFYPERDRIVNASFTRGSVSRLIKISDIHNVGFFRKKIKQLYNLNIREFITETRMAFALELLKDQGLSIKEIAHKTGFPNASYFSRVFSHYSGQSPRIFRSGFAK